MKKTHLILVLTILPLLVSPGVIFAEEITVDPAVCPGPTPLTVTFGANTGPTDGTTVNSFANNAPINYHYSDVAESKADTVLYTNPLSLPDGYFDAVEPDLQGSSIEPVPDFENVQFYFQPGGIQLPLVNIVLGYEEAEFAFTGLTPGEQYDVTVTISDMDEFDELTNLPPPFTSITNDQPGIDPVIETVIVSGNGVELGAVSAIVGDGDSQTVTSFLGTATVSGAGEVTIGFNEYFSWDPLAFPPFSEPGIRVEQISLAGPSPVYCTIQEAIDNSSPGDTIVISSGNYAGTLIVDKAITLQGEDRDTTFIQDGVSFTNTSPIVGVTLQELTISGNAGDDHILNMKDAPIADFTMDNVFLDGQNTVGLNGATPEHLSGVLSIFNSEFANILGWSVFDTAETPTSPTSPYFNAIYFENNYVHDNEGTIELGSNNNARVGATLSNGANPINIIGNTIENIKNYNDPGGDCSSQWAGIDIGGATYAEITGNTITNVEARDSGCYNPSHNEDPEMGIGLFMWGIESALIQDNTFLFSNYGIMWSNDHHHGPVNTDLPKSTITIENNRFISNNIGFGYFIYDGANNHADSFVNGVYDLTPNTLDNNYWGDASGPLNQYNPNGLGNNSTEYVEIWYTNENLTTLNQVNEGATIIVQDTNLVTQNGDMDADSVIFGIGTGLDSGLILQDILPPITISNFTNNIDLVTSIDLNPHGSLVLVEEGSSVSLTVKGPITISGEDNWDGIIYPPQIVSLAGTPPNGLVPITVYQVGSPDSVLILDESNNPFEILLKGITGKVGYKLAGVSDWVVITEQCGGNYSSPENPAYPFECYISDGSDTKIVTWHLTNVAGFSSSSSGKSGGCSDCIAPSLVSAKISSSSILSQNLDEENKVITFSTGEPITVEFVLYENSAYGISHIELLTDITSNDAIYDSNLWVEYNKNTPLIIENDNNIWQSIDVSINDDSQESTVTFTITFDEPMNESDIIIRTWDLNRNSADFRFENVWLVEKSTTNDVVDSTTNTDKKELDKESKIEKKAEIIDKVKSISKGKAFTKESFDKWGGYSSESINDKEFLDNMGIAGEKIPEWVNDPAKWFNEGLISEKEFVSILKNLEKRNLFR